MAERNPFVTLECVKEHIDSAWVSLAFRENVSPRDIRRLAVSVGTVAYHLKAAEEAVCRLYQQLAVALPGARALDEGEVTDTIVTQIERSADDE